MNSQDMLGVCRLAFSETYEELYNSKIGDKGNYVQLVNDVKHYDILPLRETDCLAARAVVSVIPTAPLLW